MIAMKSAANLMEGRKGNASEGRSNARKAKATAMEKERERVKQARGRTRIGVRKHFPRNYKEMLQGDY